MERVLYFRYTLSALAQHWQRDNPDHLLNNASASLGAIHFKGVFFLTQKLLPLLANGGCIVNISTGLTRFAMPGYAA